MRSRADLHLEFPFTHRDTPELRSRIAADLERIARRLHGVDRHLDALALTGGFSRGEGTAIAHAPINDYDLLAIRAHPGGERRYRAQARQLSEDLGIEVDVLPVWRARLPYVGPKLFWLDVRLGARVVSGDPRALSSVRPFGPHEIARGEIARLLGNRAAGLLLALPGEGEEPDPFLRDLQATKAALAAMDAAVLSAGVYPARMRDRLLATRYRIDHSTFQHAVAWKLDPSYPLPARWWELARDALLRAVDETGARGHTDGFAERALHLVRAGRIAISPSQAVRRRAWDLLSRSEWPEGPIGAKWREQKRAFFAEREKTLQ